MTLGDVTLGYATLVQGTADAWRLYARCLHVNLVERFQDRRSVLDEPVQCDVQSVRRQSLTEPATRTKNPATTNLASTMITALQHSSGNPVLLTFNSIVQTVARISKRLAVPLVALVAITCFQPVTDSSAQDTRDAQFIRQHFTKIERQIPMRDGVKLFTSIYIPNDAFSADRATDGQQGAASAQYPIMLQRTPYSVRPYGEDYKTTLGPSMELARDGYIFAYQDVRGKMMSEGQFEAVRPHIRNKRPTDIDESTDTYDTVQWLLDNIANNNGRVGVWGISAPGFYATHALIDAHPAVKAVSPQAPVTDWWIGDDRHHNGALQLQATFSFVSAYGAPHPEPTTESPRGFRDYDTPDGYEWYLGLGPLSEVSKKFFNDENEVWSNIMAHETYDAFWQERSTLPHLNNVKPAVLVVGGFFDAQDLYGPLKTYQTIEANNPNTQNFLVMGPWWHGGWARSNGDRYGDLYFGQATAEFYRTNIERSFFNHFLKDEGLLRLPEASIFITGSNRWHFFDNWPPSESREAGLFLQPGGQLAFEPPVDNSQAETFAEYVSDPRNPIPNTPQIVVTRDDRYVIQDQRFAATRPDVLVFETDPLLDDVTIAGDLTANLFVTTTGTDADFIVKLIDVYPGNMQCELPDESCSTQMGGFQQMVRGEVMRSKFRNSFEHPEPMTPGEVTEVSFDMQDAAHTFRKGHKIMVHIQSTWFPMVDRNPQQFMNMRETTEADYRVATHRVYFSPDHPSHISWRILE